jgi:hypothetical protein
MRGLKLNGVEKSSLGYSDGIVCGDRCQKLTLALKKGIFLGLIVSDCIVVVDEAWRFRYGKILSN